MPVIIGLNAFHPDAAACLVVDGKLVAAVAEERLGNRVKHAGGFPSAALRCVLQMGGVSVKDIDYVALGHQNGANFAAKAAYVLKHPLASSRAVAAHFGRRTKMKGLRELVSEACGVELAACRFQIVEVEHHLAHLASAFYSSAFDDAAGFSYDGSGDFVSGMYARCRDHRIDVLERVHVPDSLGFFYTAVCQFIGFERFGEEYKVMGLAAYGEPRFLDSMQRLLRSGSRGNYALDPSCFAPIGKDLSDCASADGEIKLPPLYSDGFWKLFGEPRKRDVEIGQREKDLAASCQRRFEEVVMEKLHWLHSEVGGDRLVTAGGCALNGVCNARILRDTPFRNSYIQCAASDDGTSIGAALYVWNCVLKGERSPLIDHAYWGPEPQAPRMHAALDAKKVPYERLDRPSLLNRAATHLHQGHVVGWYQGRSEWGPRALGNRSILAHPGWPGMKEVINEKIKRRESFRPFAPSILAGSVRDYFEQDIRSPFMMHVVKIRPERRQELAAVCHEDSTGRLHTVERSQNPIYFDLIREFANLSGTPVLLNTSFNENEPIVNEPEQAVACFLRTDMDVLVLGPFVACKPGKTIKSPKLDKPLSSDCPFV